jgi:hypothetical protein
VGINNNVGRASRRTARRAAHRARNGPVARDHDTTARLARGIDVAATLHVEGRTHGACIASPESGVLTVVSFSISDELVSAAQM